MRAETAALNAATDETRRQRENADEAPDAIGIARAELAARSQSAWKGDNKLQPGMTADIVALLAIEADLIEADVIERERLANARRSQRAWRTAAPVTVVIRAR